VAGACALEAARNKSLWQMHVLWQRQKMKFLQQDSAWKQQWDHK